MKFKPGFMLLVSVIMGMVAANAIGQEKQAPPALKVGDSAPDFELETIDGKVKLSDEIKKGNSVVLLFTRANW